MKLYSFLMARQAGAYRIAGTVGDLCFYKMDDGFYVRMKSSLTGRRFWKDAAFAGSRRSCKHMQAASSLASNLYRQLPNEQQAGRRFQKLVGEVKKQLKQGSSEAEIQHWFQLTYLQKPQKTKAKTSGMNTRSRTPKQIFIPIQFTKNGIKKFILTPNNPGKHKPLPNGKDGASTVTGYRTNASPQLLPALFAENPKRKPKQRKSLAALQPT